MLFLEKTTQNGYNYRVEDVFGEIEIDSTTKLTGELLDDMVLLIMRQGPGMETVEGEVKHKKGIVEYHFKRAKQWEPEDEEPCDDTHTSTKKQGEGFILIILLNLQRRIKNVLNWPLRFVEAFREAWRNPQK